MQEYQRGQILLIVVLVMVTALTIGLSVAARTITNTRTSQEAENSEKAFSAAEAGIEQSLTNSNNVSGSFTNNTTYKTTVSTIAGNEISLNNGSPVLKDDTQDVWLSTYPGYGNPWSGSITFYWGQPNDSCTNAETTGTLAALELLVLSGTTTNPQLTRYAVDPCSQRSLNNKFEYITSGGGTVDGKTYSYKKTISVTSGLLIRVIPLYGSVAMGVTGCDGANANCAALPSQGTLITSVGTADTTQRKLVSYRHYPKLPIEIFPYSFFAPK